MTNRLLGAVVLSLLLSSAGAATSPYELERYEALKYANRLELQAQRLQEQARQAKDYYRRNEKALAADLRHAEAFARLRHAEQSAADAKVFAESYPEYHYDITVSKKETEAKLK